MSPAPRPSAAEPLLAMQQEVARLATLPEVRAAMEWFREQEAQFTRWQLEVARIAAPPFGEAGAIGLAGGEICRDRVGEWSSRTI